MLILLVVSTSMTGGVSVSGQSHGKALILSSLEKYVPMARAADLQRLLTEAGYQVTFLQDEEITIKLLTTKLNGYDLVIWRTNAYDWGHITYWYVGELTNKATMQAYSRDVAARYLDDANAILGVNINFLMEHFPAGSLNHVKLAVLTASISANIATVFIAAGVKGTVDYYQSFSLKFGTMDGVTTHVLASLTNGATLHDAVWKIVEPYMYGQYDSTNPLDDNQLPPVWYMGNSQLTIP
jgi:hypothetical protein